MKLVIGKLIQEKGLKITYVADKLGVNRRTVSNWIDGMTDPPFFMMVKLAKLLDVSLYDLFEE